MGSWKGNYVDGQWLPEGSGAFLEVLDKYSSVGIAKLPMATDVQMERAIVAAQKGFEEIRSWSAGKRSQHLYKLADLLKAQRAEFVDLLISEAGKPRGYSNNEIDRCITTIETAAAEALRFGGEVVPIDHGAGAGKTAFTKRFPIGIIACITPFNFPLNLVLHKVAPALAVGCSVIVKPAPQAPLCTFKLAELVEKAGYPAGVFNAIVCDIPVAEKMVRDERVAMLSFTGSDKVGWYLKGICGKKRVALELGGNAAVLIDEVKDVAQAADTVAKGAYLYAGQICISTQRIFVHDNIYDDFANELIARIKALPVGDPNKDDTLVGPIIDKGHLTRIESWVHEAVAGGAEVLTGGQVQSAEHNVFQPTLLGNTSKDMKVACAEAFGPVAVIERVSSFDEAIAMANDSDFGLQAGVYTDSLENMKKAHEELEVGGVIINNVPGFRIDNMPYGGVKDSGLGREGLRYAMEEMSEPRLLVY